MRKPCRIILVLAAVGGLAGVARVAQILEPSGLRMAGAADRFLASLTPEQKNKGAFEFDDAERVNWHFVPLQDADRNATRKGLRLKEMNDKQKAAAKELLRAGTSADGYNKATTIMSLEAILKELEQGGNNVRDPQWYFFTVFGKPSRTGKWGWRVEGHHLSLNFVVDSGKVVAATPAFFGANPATVRDGARKGLRTLPQAEDLAIALFKALDREQREIAHVKKQFPEVQGRTHKPQAGSPQGLPASQMTAKQREVLESLVRSYASRMPEDVADSEIKEVEKAGLERVHFAFAGGTESGQAHTYRVQGPTFLIEFLNVQADSANNPANHIHSVWRDVRGDFGLTQAGS